MLTFKRHSGRCFRRKDYSIGRGTPDARIEVWVAYDRLWRSGNRLGSPISPGLDGHTKAWGQLWEDAEYGFDGEPLGCESRPGQGEGKNLSTHLRQSHRKFVENIKCHGCGMGILERCEHCSIRMHCMGCRKTLCESCAFLRPLPLARSTSRPQPIKGADFDANHHWWAPGQTRNPNLMMQEVLPSTSTELSGSVPNSTVTPALRMQWCCLKPMFTNGGSIQFVGPGMSGPAIAHVRTAPLPMGQGFEDAEFMRLRHPEDIARSILDEPGPSVFSPKVRQYQMLQWLLYGPGSNDHNPCPRSLCQECWQITGWRAACQACKEPFCFAHDLRGLTMRICGYKDLTVEKANMDTNPDIKHTWEDWGKYTLSLNASRTETKKKLRAYLGDHRNLSGLSPNLRKKYLRLLEAPESEIDAYIEMNEPVLEELSGRKKSASCGSSPPHSREDMATIDAASSKEGTEGTANDVWRGCGSFLCPQFRSIGDHRPRCSAAAKQCTFCDVHVCPECLAQKPACGCSYCKDNYACPECLPSITQLCKKVEEEEKAAQREGGRIEAGEVDISDERGGANG